MCILIGILQDSKLSDKKGDVKMIWNVSLLNGSTNVFGYQVEAKDIMEAVEKAEEHFSGELIKVCLADYDDINQ